MNNTMNAVSPRYLLLMAGKDDAECAALAHVLEQGGYIITRTADANEAVSLIGNTTTDHLRFDAVVACLDHSSQDAITLLERIHRLFPDVTRVLIADTEQSQALSPALNQGIVERLFFRPCAGERLLGIVDEAVKLRHDSREHARCIQRIDQLERRVRTVDVGATRPANEAPVTGAANYYDEMTGIASPSLLQDRLGHAIETGKRDGSKVVLLLLGVDRFQYINESFGRDTGDRVLTEIAARISGCVRSSDTVGRYGEDVFGLVVTGSQRTEEPAVMAQRILDAVAMPLKVGDQYLVLTASVGISWFPSDGRQPQELTEKAESAMRHAKLQHGNQIRCYSPEFNRIADRRLSLESELRRAIDRHEFVLYYQPRIDTTLNRVVGAEALLRWMHPSRGVLAPGGFLPVLEETGLIEPVGHWVLEEAMRALKRWRHAELPQLLLAVNLSARQFRRKRLPEFVSHIADAVALDLSERMLELEITESLLMHDIESTRRTLNRLHEMGLRIAIDDFGTGYSALSYLIKFSLDYLKIDKSFVDRLGDSEDAKAIVEAIVSLSYSLRLTVIAEGVETREQLTALQALGCKQFQGFLFAKPMPEREFVELVARDGGASIATLAPVDRLLHEPIHEPRRRKFN